MCIADIANAQSYNSLAIDPEYAYLYIEREKKTFEILCDCVFEDKRSPRRPSDQMVGGAQELRAPPPPPFRKDEVRPTSWAALQGDPRASARRWLPSFLFLLGVYYVVFTCICLVIIILGSNMVSRRSRKDSILLRISENTSVRSSLSTHCRLAFHKINF